MRIDGRGCRSLEGLADGSVEILDQTRLPYSVERLRLTTAEQVATAIATMQVRGAPLIGVAGAYGVSLALRADAGDLALATACDRLCATRPTAVNLRRRVEQVREEVTGLAPSARADAAWALAGRIAEEEVEISRRIGEHGAKLLAEVASRTGRTVNVLTHCNAGWLATIDGGTALAPIYRAHRDGVPVHVWVDETRPRNQGQLTAFELQHEGIPCTLIVDNAGGHLMQHGRVDLCLVGTDRTTATGDACNKIGTYLKALAAKDNGVPFYVAAPESSIDWTLEDGVRGIPIEERAGDEVRVLRGRANDGSAASIELTPEQLPVANFGFDVTPARLVTGLITERGICAASRDGLLALFPERRP